MASFKKFQEMLCLCQIEEITDVVEQNHKQICTLKMSFIPICYSSLQNVVSRYS